jgi:hypothetical protein
MGHSIRGSHSVGDDGSFKLLVFPGPGVVCASGDFDTYLVASVAKKDAESGVGDNVMFSSQEIHGILRVNGHAYHVIRPGENPETVKFDLKLDRGQRVTGSVTADGKAVAGVRAVEFRRYGAYDLPVRVTVDEAAGTFTAVGLDPRKKNLMVFYRENERLVGSTEPRGDENGPVAVRLQPWAVASGRVLGPDGKPAAGASVHVFCRDGNRELREFRSGPLAKSITVRVQFVAKKGEDPTAHDIDGISAKAGETKDLGDVKIPPPQKE